ncbi:MAG: hypothetical protein KIT00_04645 [Rhodospirillales bacterium]|nr:hypothetical protein [Rhodospirillales bacterium]
MQDLLGTSIGVYIIVVVVIMGFAAFMTGQATARNWKPIGQLVFATVLLGCASRFLVFALYEGKLFSLSGYIIDFVVLMLIGGFAYFFTRARCMVAQYPWLYRRAGLFGWRKQSSTK